VSIPHQEAARPIGEEHPLVRIDRDGVRALDAGESAPPLVAEHERAAVRAVDVQPEMFAAAQVCDGPDRIHRSRVRRARGRAAEARPVKRLRWPATRSAIPAAWIPPPGM